MLQVILIILILYGIYKFDGFDHLIKFSAMVYTYLFGFGFLMVGINYGDFLLGLTGFILLYSGMLIQNHMNRPRVVIHNVIERNN